MLELDMHNDSFTRYIYIERVCEIKSAFVATKNWKPTREGEVIKENSYK